MNIVVTDANILIDLCELDILEEFFSLPYNMSVVGAVWDELSDEQQQMYANYLDDGRFSLVPQEDINLITINEIKESRQHVYVRFLGTFPVAVAAFIGHVVVHQQFFTPHPFAIQILF